VTDTVELNAVDDPGKAVKVTRIMENHPHKIIGIAPATQYSKNKLEIRTITSPFILEEG
jgi:hypothetical protein